MCLGDQLDAEVPCAEARQPRSGASKSKFASSTRMSRPAQPLPLGWRTLLAKLHSSLPGQRAALLQAFKLRLKSLPRHGHSPTFSFSQLISASWPLVGRLSNAAPVIGEVIPPQAHLRQRVGRAPTACLHRAFILVYAHRLRCGGVELRCPKVARPVTSRSANLAAPLSEIQINKEVEQFERFP